MSKVIQPSVPQAERLHFGAFVLDADRTCLLHDPGDGKLAEVTLRPKSFDVLLYLVRHPRRLVTRDELLAAVWPKVVVTDDSVSRCISEVRSALADAASLVRTIPTRGYIFDGDVTREAQAAATDGHPVAGAAVSDVPPAPDARRHSARRWLAVAGAFAFAGLVLGYQLVHERQAAPPRLSLVVLPFVNQSGDPGQEYFADALTDDLTIAVARLRGATVIAPGSAFAFKGSQVDPRQLGTTLNVRYAVAGGVARGTASVRINARLVDTGSGKNLWTDQFEVAREDVAKAQDDIVTRIANALDAELTRADAQRTRRSGTNLDAEDLAMQCEAATRMPGEDSGDASVAPCDAALRIDPHNVRALVNLGTFYAMRVSRVQSTDAEADLERANVAILRALDQRSDDYAAHCAHALVLGGRGRLRDALAETERCRDLNPSHAGAFRMLAIDYFFLGEPLKALESADRGIRLSPRDPQLAAFYLFKGWAYFMLGRSDDALEWLRRAAATAPELPNAQVALASQLALAGRDAEAHAALARYLALPQTRTRTIAQWNLMPDDNSTFRAFDARFKEGLRLAGMPER